MKIPVGTMGVIGCFPTSMSESPTDQEDVSVGQCQACECDIWVSKKKRDIQALHPLLLMLCLPCSVQAMDIMNEGRGNGNGNGNIDVVDIRNV
jgi:hypothetical protein